METHKEIVRYNSKGDEQKFLAADNGKVVETTGWTGDLGWKSRDVCFL